MDAFDLFWQVYQTIKNKLNTLGTQYFDKKPHEMATFGFNTNGLNSEFQTNFVGMANIWSVSAFPPNCKADVGNTLEQNKSVNVYVKLRDFQKLAPFKESGLKETNMDIVMKDPTGIFFYLYVIDIDNSLRFDIPHNERSTSLSQIQRLSFLFINNFISLS